MVTKKRISPFRDLDRLQVNGELCIETVGHFGHWFKRAVGPATTLTAGVNRRSLDSISCSRAAFNSPDGRPR